MELKEAAKLLKPFTSNGVKITPALADDWTYTFDTMYTRSDKIILSSETLNQSIFVDRTASGFFRNYIFTGQYEIDKNHIVGNFAVNKDGIIPEVKFNEAYEIISLGTIEVIENDELIENYTCLSEDGKEYLYLGHMHYKTIRFDKEPIIRVSENPSKKRFIIELNSHKLGIKPIGKTASKKFIEMKDPFSEEKKDKLFKDVILPYGEYGFVRPIFINGTRFSYGELGHYEFVSIKLDEFIKAIAIYSII